MIGTMSMTGGNMQRRAFQILFVICASLSSAADAAQKQGCEPCPLGSVYVNENDDTCFCKCNTAAGYRNEGGQCARWTRVPAIVSGMSCDQLRGTSLRASTQVFWKPVETATLAIPGTKGTDAAGVACSCKWRASYQLTSTRCRRNVEEEATINGVHRTRTVTIEEPIIQRQSVLASDQTTSGRLTGVMHGGSDCACDPPAGGQVDR
jgi:hypothetical protein